MLFMILTSSWAMVVSLDNFVRTASVYRAVIISILLVLEVWMIIEAVICVRKERACS